MQRGALATGYRHAAGCLANKVVAFASYQALLRHAAKAALERGVSPSRTDPRPDVLNAAGSDAIGHERAPP